MGLDGRRDSVGDFGVLLAVWPGEGLVALVWIFGIYALVFGIMQLVVAYRVRRMQHA